MYSCATSWRQNINLQEHDHTFTEKQQLAEFERCDIYVAIIYGNCFKSNGDFEQIEHEPLESLNI